MRLVGTAGDDVLVGTPGDDVIFGGEGNDTIDGLEGSDIICGGDGDDTLVGNEDADTIFGGGGDDVIGGGKGDDLLVGGTGADTIDGRRGDDLIFGGDGNDVLRGRQDADTISGGGGDDVIDGDDGADVLHGGAGADDIDGGQGTDLLDGGEGNDDLAGNQDNDTLFGGPGDDFVSGGKHNDVLHGGPGLDSLNGRTGDDSLDGGPGDDTAIGNSGVDSCDDASITVGCETTTAVGPTNDVSAPAEPVAPAAETSVHSRTYDGRGSLVAVDVDGDATEFVWDSNQAVPQILTISDAAGSADQLYGLTRLAELTSAGADPYGFTVLGDINELGTGFDPFGNPLSTPSSEIGFGYRTELHVGEQIHLRARDLHAGLNRFTAVDPLDGVMGTVVETAPFHYANNDPINMVDPLGLRPGGGSLRPGDEDWNPADWCRENGGNRYFHVETDGMLGCFHLDPCTSDGSSNPASKLLDAAQVWSCDYGDELIDWVLQPTASAAVGILCGGPAVGSACGGVFFRAIDAYQADASFTESVTHSLDPVHVAVDATVGGTFGRVFDEIGARAVARFGSTADDAGAALGARAANERVAHNVGGARNVAVADYAIDGVSGRLTGVSGSAERVGTVPVPSNPVFQPSSVGGFSRALDAEYKILEELARRLGPANSSVSGTVNLYSELTVCPSCASVVDQFRARYPKVVVNVFSG